MRLIFVAITRARHKLFITTPNKVSKKSEDLTILPHLGDIPVREIETNSDPAEKLEIAWNSEYVKVTNDLKTLLAPRLANYKLNATAVNNFTNLEYAGPEQFLLNNLLRFPSAKSPAADYGTAIHETMKFVHNYFNKNSKKPSDKEVVSVFDESLRSMHMLKTDYSYYLAKGKSALPNFINRTEFNKNQQVEQVFDAKIDEMNLTGKMDLIEIDEKAKTITVFDYKTGDGFEKFNSGKIKTHNYYQQLMFYKLLIDNANNRPGYHVNRGVLHFVEADKEPFEIEMNYDDAELKEFKKLLGKIWNHIMELEFPDVSDYPKSLKGTREFEEFMVK